MEQPFSKDHTQLAKSLAVCLLLVHHLFFSEAAGYTEMYVGGTAVVHECAAVAKVCVCLFVMLSGFGLSRSSRSLEPPAFYRRRLVRLYPAYWMTWLLCVPVAALWLGRTPASVYPESTGLYMLANLLGIQVYFGTYGYIATWWFMTAILTLYALFPVLIRIPLLPLLVISFLLDVVSPWFVHGLLRHWLFPFVAGMALDRYDVFRRLADVRHPRFVACLFAAAAAAFAWPRLHLENIGLELWTDTPLAASLLCLLFAVTRKKRFSRGNILLVPGRLSYEIFLSHTFVITYFCKDIVYACKQPAIIFIVGLGLSLAAAWLIQTATTACAGMARLFRGNASPLSPD